MVIINHYKMKMIKFRKICVIIIVMMTLVFQPFLSPWTGGARAQKYDANGNSVPLILERNLDNPNTALLCVDEDPDTGDRVYGGYTNIYGEQANGIVGMKKAGTHDMTDPRSWNWKFRYSIGIWSFAILVCHWTPTALPFFGHKGIVLIGSLEGNYDSKYLIVIDPADTSSGSVVIKFFRRFDLAALSYAKYDLVLKDIIRSYLRVSGDHIRLYAMGREINKILKLVEFSHEVGTSVSTAKAVSFRKFSASWIEAAVQTTDFLFTDTSLYIAYSGPMRTYGDPKQFLNAIARTPIPSNPLSLDFSVAGLVPATVRGYWTNCKDTFVNEVNQFGPLAEYNNLVSFVMFEANHRSDLTSYMPNDEFYLGVECTVDSNLYSAVKIVTQGYKKIIARGLYAHNDSTYYFLFYNGFRGTVNAPQLVVAKMVVKFTSASCGSTSPVLDGTATASVFTPPVFNPKQSVAIAYNNPGKGSVLYSNSVQGFILTGSVLIPEDDSWSTATSDKKGFALAISLSEVDSGVVDQGWTVNGVDLLAILNPLTYIIETASAQSFPNQAGDDVTFFYFDTNKFEVKNSYACAFSLKLKNPFPSTTTLTYQYSANLAAFVDATPYILIEDLVDVVSGCPPTHVEFVLNDGLVEASPVSSTFVLFDASTKRLNMLGTTLVTDHKVHLWIRNDFTSLVTPQFTISILASPCDSATITMSQLNAMLTVGLKFDIDDNAVALTEAECPPVTYDLVALNLLVISNTADCPPTTLEISQMQQSSSTTIPPSEWSPMITLTNNLLKIEKYHLIDKTTYLNANIFYNFFRAGVTGVVDTAYTTIAFQDHVCQSTSLTVTSPAVNEIEIKMTIADFDKTATANPTGTDLKLESALQLISSDAVNCPITAWKIDSLSKICDSTFTCSPVQSETLSTISFVSTSSATGEITVEEQLDEMDLHISVKATTLYNKLVSTDLWKLKIRFSMCFSQDIISMQLDKAKTATLAITVWETDKNTTVALGNATALTFNPETDNFFTNTISSDCPFKKFRMKEVLTSTSVVVSEAEYKDFITFDSATAKIDIQNYTKIHTTFFNGTMIQVDTMTEAKQSTVGTYLTLLITEFKCDKDKVAIKTAPEEIKVSYQTFVKLTGEMVKPEASSVEAQELDLSTGYFDTGSDKSCLLTEWSLTKVKSKDDTEIATASWAQIFLFNSTFKKLQVMQFGGADVTILGESRLIFQAKLEDETYSHEYHFVTVIIEENFLIEENTAAPKPPFFKSRLAPIPITLDFNDTTATFAQVVFEFPELADPQNSTIEPIKITNIADLGFATFSGIKLTIDPNQFKPDEIGSRISVKVGVKNALGAEGEYFLTIVVQQLVKEEPIPVVEELVPEPVPVPEPEPEPVVEEKKEEVKKEEKVKAASTASPNFAPDWNKFFKNKKQQQATKSKVLTPEEEEEVQPPQPPELRVLSLGSKGEFSMSFSDAIEFPEALKEKFERDKLLLAQKAKNGTDGTDATKNSTGESRRLKRGGNFMDFKVEGATNMKQQPLDDSMFVIEELSDKKIKFKINFPNPASLSLSDQSVQDRLKIGFSELPIGKNGLPLMTTGLASNADGSLTTDLNIQPMVDENSQSQLALDQASDSVYYSGVGMMLLQFIITLVASTSLVFFWTLINSQINYVYLPLLSVNPPGQVSFYLEILIFVCTFDPIPTDLVYEAIPIWAFDKVDMPNDRDVFSRIGFEDRNIISVLGSVFLFGLCFFFGQSLFQFLRPLAKYSHKARNTMRKLSLGAAYRTIFIVFFLETYLDLLLGGFVNSENTYLMYDARYWGWTAWMSKSDQFAIILGNIIFACCLVFPFVVMIILQKKYEQRYNTDQRQAGFNSMYDCLYEGLRTNQPGYTHYYSIYLVRKLIFGMIVYYLHQMHFCTAQVMANMYLSFFFILYLVSYKPFLDQHEQYMQVLNEICFYFVSFLYVCFTDINPNAENKLIIGWCIIFLVIANLIWPNGSTMVKGIWPDIKALFVKEPKKIDNLGPEEKRQDLIKKYDLKLKTEFNQADKDDFASTFPTRNQVAPTDLFAELGPMMDVFEMREEKREEMIFLRHNLSEAMREGQQMDGYMHNNDLSDIQEMDSYREHSSRNYDSKYSDLDFEDSIIIKQ